MSFRHALQTYIDHPANPRVVVHTAGFVIVRDRFPKALRHFLVLPTDPTVTHMHPLAALQDYDLHVRVTAAAEQAKDVIVAELVAEGLVEDTPGARAHFRNTFIKAGVHSTPSMANLHVHVITCDFLSPHMKNKRHYNSFTTPFFVELRQVAAGCSSDSASGSDSDDWSLGAGTLAVRKKAAARRSSVSRNSTPLRNLANAHQSGLSMPLACAYCGASYGSQFAALKKHLCAEFAERFPHAGDSFG